MDSDEQETTKSRLTCVELMLITLLLIPIGFSSVNFISRSVVDHFPLIPDVAVESTSAASISRLSATAALAEGLLVGILLHNNNTRPLSFSRVRIVSPAGAAKTARFAVESGRSAVVWFRLENATVPMAPPGIPSLRVVFEARVRFGGREIWMISECFPAEIGLNLNVNSNLTNYSSEDMNIGEDAAEILKSGGCESKGLWSKNREKMRLALYLGLLVLVAFILVFLVVSAWVMAELRQYRKTFTHQHHNYQNLAEALIYF